MLFLPHKTVVEKYASVSHHSSNFRPPASAVEGRGFPKHKNQLCSGKTINPVHKAGSDNPKGFSPNQTKYIYVVFELAGLSTPQTDFDMPISSLRPELHFYESTSIPTNVDDFQKEDGALTVRISERPFRKKAKKLAFTEILP